MLDLVKLGKVLALVDSSNEGEAAAAIESARRLLARDGKRFADLATMLMETGTPAPPAPPPAPAPPPSPPPSPAPAPTAAPPPRPDFRGRRTRTGIPDPQVVLGRHGGRDAVLAPCSREKLLRTAVARWSVAQDAPNERWTRSLSGWTSASLPRHMPPEIRRAVETAYSLPTSVAGAMAELEYWERRGAEIASMRGMDGQVVADDVDPTLHLDLPAYARAIAIRRLVEHGLRAANIQDALARAEYWRAHSGRGSWVEAAILADLRHLAGLDRAARGQDGNDADGGQPSHFRTASERREEVIRILADPAMAALPDREIARRVGVSPQTVGNLRRRVTDGGHHQDNA
ncbi:DUF2786 domain-containing protein [Niveispirillum sp. KHB5.9]|uniref:DUF2786 domain-containing protein n=1 Tax=Niveispirillum sp. KHB5.9 TaxID=3400269 RepID=UPI003A8BD628